MGKRLDLAQVRERTNEAERQQVKRLAHSRTAPARTVERARVVQGALDGERVEEIATRLGLTRNTVYLLLEGERLQQLPEISKELDKMIEEKAGRVAAEVVSAKPLDPSQLSQITATLEKLSGKKVSVTTRQDAELLGGVVAKVGDTVYDGSLRTQLRTLRDELSK